MEKTTQEQQAIKQWFDKTYSSHGELYLRPKEAYIIYAELLQLKKGMHFLDVACGLGRMLEVGADYGVDNYGIDLSEVAVAKTKAKLPDAHILEANAEKIPFEDSIFDAVTCLGSLERMLNHAKVLTEIKRVSKPNATFCFLVRNSNSWRWLVTKKLFGTINKTAHQDAKTMEEWRMLFLENGFEIKDCLPDQWPVMNVLRLLSFGFFRPFHKKQPSVLPLRFANEFIFILTKKK